MPHVRRVQGQALSDFGPRFPIHLLKVPRVGPPDVPTAPYRRPSATHTEIQGRSCLSARPIAQVWRCHPTRKLFRPARVVTSWVAATNAGAATHTGVRLVDVASLGGIESSDSPRPQPGQKGGVTASSQRGQRVAAHVFGGGSSRIGLRRLSLDSASASRSEIVGSHFWHVLRIGLR